MKAPAVIFDLTLAEANDLYALADNVGYGNEDYVLRRSLMSAADRIVSAIGVAEHRGKDSARITLTAVQADTLQVLAQNVHDGLEREEEELYPMLKSLYEKLAAAETDAEIRATRRLARR